MRARPLLVGLLCVLVLAACGGDDGDEGGGGETADADLSSEEQAYADAWAGALSDEDDGLSVDGNEADCMGAAIMSELGTQPFEDAGITPEDVVPGSEDDTPGELLGAGTISESQADSIIDTWESCADLPELVAESAGAEFGLDDEGRQCFAERLGEEDRVRDLLRSLFTSDTGAPPEDAVTTLLKAVTGCEGGQEAIIDSMAAGMAADGGLDDEQSQCVAEGLVDIIGFERLIELGLASGNFEEAPADVQEEMTNAVLDAAQACDVPLSQLGG